MLLALLLSYMLLLEFIADELLAILGLDFDLLCVLLRFLGACTAPPKAPEEFLISSLGVLECISKLGPASRPLVRLCLLYAEKLAHRKTRLPSIFSASRRLL